MPTGQVNLLFIYADNCEHCDESRAVINHVITDLCHIPCIFRDFKYNDRAAINIAINNDINDLPGLVVGETALVKDDITYDAVYEAILEVEESWKKKKKKKK